MHPPPSLYTPLQHAPYAPDPGILDAVGVTQLRDNHDRHPLSGLRPSTPSPAPCAHTWLWMARDVMLMVPGGAVGDSTSRPINTCSDRRLKN